jgi:tetratricopeptide (TPR) repeat protein
VPERLDNLVGLGAAQLELRRPEAAEPPLLKATEVAVDSIEAWEALARVHEALGRRKELEDAWKTVAAIHKDRGNEARAKEILQLYITPEAIEQETAADLAEASHPDLDVSVTGDDTLSALGNSLDAELGGGAKPAAAAATPVAPVATAAVAQESTTPAATRAAAPAAAKRAPVATPGDDEIDIELDDEVAGAGESTGQAVADATAGEADAAQLLAEAGVYLRYSQHEKAVQCLERVLANEPGHLGALEKLGEARKAAGDPGAAVEIWKEAAGYARAAGDGAGFAAMCQRIRRLDEATAAALEAEARASESQSPASAPEPAVAAAPAPVAAPEPEGDLDFELAFDTPSGEPELTGASEAPHPDLEDLLDERSPFDATGAGGPPPVAPSEEDLRFDLPADGVRLDADASSGRQEISAEDLEEAEFYLRQGLHDEAEQILRRLLASAPGHPQVLLRLGEIAKLRGESPSAPVSEDVDFDQTEEDTHPGTPAAKEEPVLAAEEDATSEQELREPSPTAAAARSLPDDPDELEADAGAALDVASADAEEGFDLAAELSDVFEESQSGLPEEEEAGGTTQAGFQSIFQSFKQGVQETLGEGEHETHYDLGIAYREMGLLDDAVREFRVAMASPARKLDCLAMMGLCALDLGRHVDAVSHLEQALAMPGLPDERVAGLRFDLGRVYEAKGDLARARSLWEQVQAFDPDFPELAERLATLGRADSSPSLGTLEATEPGEALESFDDLIAEAESGFADDDAGDGDDPGDDSGSSAGRGNATSRWGRKVSYG